MCGIMKDKYEPYAICPVRIKEKYKKHLISCLMSLLKDSNSIELRCHNDDKRKELMELNDLFGELGFVSIESEYSIREYGSNTHHIRLEFRRTLGELFGEDKE